MTAGHSMTGCHCPEHEARREYNRAYMRSRYYQRKHRPIAPENTCLRIEQAIARGEATSRIMRTLHVSYATVQLVRGRLDLINRVPA